jgi:hypothetical protein
VSPFALGFAGVATWITMLGLFVILFPVEGYAIPSYLEEWRASPRSGSAGCTLDSRLRVGIRYGKQRGVGYIGDLVSSLGTDDRSRFITWWYDRWHHPVA